MDYYFIDKLELKVPRPNSPIPWEKWSEVEDEHWELFERVSDYIEVKFDLVRIDRGEHITELRFIANDCPSNNNLHRKDIEEYFTQIGNLLGGVISGEFVLVNENDCEDLVKYVIDGEGRVTAHGGVVIYSYSTISDH